MTTKRLLRIAAKDGETALGLWEMQPVGPAILPPVLLVHGATFGSGLFDLPVAGYSLMQELARGRFVYAIDVRGYGASVETGVMNAPMAAHPPFCRARHAIEDVGAAITEIRRRRKVLSIDLIGFSWGSIVAGWYASRHAAEVRRLVLYAPLFAEKNALWLHRIGDAADRSKLAGHFGAYRLVAEADVIARWNSDGPGDPADVRADGVVEALFEAAASNDVLAGSRHPPAFRCPNGAFADLVEVFNGRPLYEPGTIEAPVLLVRGACDTTSTASDMQRLEAAIGSVEKSSLEIPDGSHFLCIEKNHMSLYRAINTYLTMD
ncbi:MULTISPECIES: alpha/beta hydrolase [unclassified Bradyrhizobium]|uniref:alpha/beta hydrolase n=1 Tax=unclassified Bradyrhizobium TaxID=2631580 RepID=UPI001BAD774A|nr:MULTISPECIES: alpha/beta fold hydrolase [unclassified Bradyrhizobium]MBR1225946.1 alpha/beta fold hydrolase [Bradyrhizobium sp. AUGA SZCCT0176]MBR1233412.1 alpha/beta fold hydrolase [Bradyrhizobium sp. AUGA SZCCT0182]MBR1296901.1 alpha/beta fold hydrolase [Bradyrhizobium sp. AUGA SZCCT0042]